MGEFLFVIYAFGFNCAMIYGFVKLFKKLTKSKIEIVVPSKDKNTNLNLDEETIRRAVNTALRRLMPGAPINNIINDPIREKIVQELIRNYNSKPINNSNSKPDNYKKEDEPNKIDITKLTFAESLKPKERESKVSKISHLPNIKRPEKLYSL